MKTLRVRSVRKNSIAMALVATVIGYAQLCWGQGVEYAAPISKTRTGVAIGTSGTPVNRHYEPWLGRKVDAVLVFGDQAASGNEGVTWPDWRANLGWLKTQFASADRPLVWSIPLFPDGTWNLADAAAGAYDANYQYAAGVIATYRPQDPVVIVRPGWEFNFATPTYEHPWVIHNATEASQFKTAFRRFVNAFRGVSARFRFDWCPNFLLGTFDPVACFPEDDANGSYVDIVSMDVYDAADSGVPFSYFFDPVPGSGNSRGLDWLATFAAFHHKPLGITEWGVGSGGDDPDFVRNMQKWMADHPVALHHYWEDSGPPTPLRDDAPPNSAKQYKASFGPADAPSNCSDQFSFTVPGAQWEFVRQNGARWSLTAKRGRLQLLSSPGDLTGTGTSSVENIVVMRGPARDFEMVAKLHGRPTAANQQAGLIAYEDDDHYIKLVRIFDAGVNRFTFAKETIGTVSSGWVDDTMSQGLAYLKIARVGSIYTGYFSADGNTWTPVGSAQASTFTTSPRLGVAAFGASGFTAEVDYVYVDKYEAEHGTMIGSAAPTPLSLTASGLDTVGWLDSSGDGLIFGNVPGGWLTIYYSAQWSGKQGLFVNGGSRTDLTFSATTGIQPLTTSVNVPVGAEVKLQFTEVDDSSWNIDYLAFADAGTGQVRAYEAEFATKLGSAANHPSDASASGGKSVTGLTSGSNALELHNLGGGSGLKVRYATTTNATGRQRLYVNGVRLPDIVYSGTASATTYNTVSVSAVIPSGATIRLQYESGAAVNVDYITLTHSGDKLEAEESMRSSGATCLQDSTASENRAVELESGQWGEMRFNDVPAGSQIRVRYRATAAGQMSVYVNGLNGQNVAYSASSEFTDLVITRSIAAGNSVKLQNDSLTGWITDYVVIE